MKFINTAVQVAVLCVISAVGNWIATWTGIGIPGSLLGMFFLLLALGNQWVSVEKIEMGANFLIAEMLLFFVPSAIGVIEFKDILQNDWSALVLAIEASIFFVLIFVVLSTELIVRYKGRETER